MADLLPDCRAKDPKGVILNSPMGNLVPVFCANCHKHCAYCPEQNMNFMFYLCNKCVQTHGEIAGTMLMPDEVFFEKLAQAQLEEHGHYLTQEEITKVVQEDASPLARLLKAGR